jgi:hypothetical protein
MISWTWRLSYGFEWESLRSNLYGCVHEKIGRFSRGEATTGTKRCIWTWIAYQELNRTPPSGAQKRDKPSYILAEISTLEPYFAMSCIKGPEKTSNTLQKHCTSLTIWFWRFFAFLLSRIESSRIRNFFSTSHFPTPRDSSATPDRRREIL